METRRVARVAVDVPLANLDRPFDYLITPAQRELVSVGVRVRVRFAQKLRDGYVVEVVDSSDRAELLPLHAVVSTEPVLAPEVIELVRLVADHYAGGFADVVRLAVPPRHGLTENAEPPVHPAPALDAPTSPTLASYPHGEGFLDAVQGGGSPRAAWTVLPRPDGPGDWIAGFLDAAQAALSSGRGAILLAPEADDVARLAEAAADRFGRGSFVTLSADLGPAARYRAFLAVRRGGVRLVVGTRSAVWAPVRELGLIALWDDGDDLWAEQRTPYPHTREVASLRAHQARSALLLAGRLRTAEVQALVGAGWVHPIEVPPADARANSAAVRVAAADERALERDPQAARARVPHEAFDVIRTGLAAGPVLVSVARAGYRPLLACAGCGAVAACPACRQPLVQVAGQQPACRWCGPPVGGWRCPDCQGTRLRAPVAGVQRTTEEFGRAFPGTRVVSSSGESRLGELDERPAIVLATPGAEPRALGGYAAAVLLDGDALLRRADLRAGEEALRRWLAVVSLVRPAAEGGTVVVVAEKSDRSVQALVRLDPVGFAARELADRKAAGFPPAAKLVMIEGGLGVLSEVAAALALPDGVERQGPFPLSGGVDPQARLTLRCGLEHGAALVGAVRTLLSVRSATKAEGSVRVRVDPVDIG